MRTRIRISRLIASVPYAAMGIFLALLAVGCGTSQSGGGPGIKIVLTPAAPVETDADGPGGPDSPVILPDSPPATALPPTLSPTETPAQAPAPTPTEAAPATATSAATAVNDPTSAPPQSTATLPAATAQSPTQSSSAAASQDGDVEWIIETATIGTAANSNINHAPGNKVLAALVSFSGPAVKAELVPLTSFALQELQGPEFPAVAIEIMPVGADGTGAALVTFEVPATATRFQLVIRPDSPPGDELRSDTLKP